MLEAAMKTPKVGHTLCSLYQSIFNHSPNFRYSKTMGLVPHHSRHSFFSGSRGTQLLYVFTLVPEDNQPKLGY
jgi:hypothetical protein